MRRHPKPIYVYLVRVFDAEGNPTEDWGYENVLFSTRAEAEKVRYPVGGARKIYRTRARWWSLDLLDEVTPQGREDEGRVDSPDRGADDRGADPVGGVGDRASGD
jgi:hypothetical protein